MANDPKEPANLVWEQLGLMRAETNTRFDRLDKRIDLLNAEVVSLKNDLRGFKPGTIAEIYKANLTVASFVDHEQRIQALERKSS